MEIIIVLPQWEHTDGGIFDFDGTDDYIDWCIAILAYLIGASDSYEYSIYGLN